MTPADYLQAVRHRWLDVVIAVVVALLAGLAISAYAPTSEPAPSYKATATVYASADLSEPQPINVEALATLIRFSDVPSRVATDINFEGDPTNLLKLIQVTPDSKTGILQITAFSPDYTRATVIANSFADQLSAFVGESHTETLATLTETLDRIGRQISDLDNKIASTKDPTDLRLLTAEGDALARRYSFTYEALNTAQADRGHLTILPATGATAESSGGIQAPKTLLSTLLLAGILGLVSGFALVLILERFDTRLRTRDSAERYLGFPVLAEIPYLKRRSPHRNGIVTIAAPRSRSADAFRLLATMLSKPVTTLPKLEVAGNGHRNGNGGTDSGGGHLAEAVSRNDKRSQRPPRTILVTGPGPSDGKTTVVANLAAALASRGKHVIVISADLRRPRIHRLFAHPVVSNEFGLVARLQAGEHPGEITEYALETDVRGVSIIPSAHVEESGELLSSGAMRAMLKEATASADFVLLDTAPILSTSDSASLLGWVDAVLVVVRAGRTTAPVAESTREMLDALGAPVVGVVLNASVDITRPGRHYYYYYYSYGDRSKLSAKLSRGIPGLPGHSRKE
jgi:capsular exopolysaccharide synthesis family protein